MPTGCGRGDCAVNPGAPSGTGARAAGLKHGGGKRPLLRNGRKRRGSDAPKAAAKVNGPGQTDKFIAGYLAGHPGLEGEIRDEAKRYTGILGIVRDPGSRFAGKEDGTYDPEDADGTGVSFASGCMVTFHQNSPVGDRFSGYTDESYALMCAIAKRELDSERVYIGVYLGKPEVSFHCDDVGRGLRFAEEHNQRSVWVCGESDEAGYELTNDVTYDERTNPTRENG